MNPLKDTNRPVVMELMCGICQTRGYLRTKPEHAVDVALAGGWMILNRKKNKIVCMAHNPARAEFWAYTRQVAAVDLAGAL